MYKGINQDLTPDKLQNGLYYYAKNIVISDHLGSVVNELGNQFIDAVTTEEVTTYLLGLYCIEDIVVVFSVTKDNFDSNFDDSFGDSVVGVFYNNVYTEIQGIREYDWSFSFYFPIQAVGHKNNKEEYIIAFTDNFNVPRVINIGTKRSFLLQSVNENETYLFPSSKVSTITASQLEQGGNLVSGMYFVSYLYEDSQGNTTKGFNVSNGVAITKDTVSIGNTNYNGVVANTETNKSLKIVVEEADTQYKFISFYIIQVIDGVTSVVVTEKQPITSNYIEKIYTGNETTYDATIEEVLIGNASYIKARTITSHAKALYVANLETEEEINLQPFVNHIQINPVSKLIDVTSLTDNQKTNSIRGFMHDEVYAFYIRFWRNGKPTRSYHIPGRPEVQGDKVIIDGQSFYIKNDTSFSGGFSSMGFWENVNEPYPLTGGFPTGNVRHHKFPSISTCKKVLYNTENEYGKTKLDVLGIEVVFNQALPIEFDSWEILYAKREEATTIGTDLLLYAGDREGDANAIWTTAGNWDVNTTKAGTGSWDDMDLREDYIRLHNFELLYTSTSRIPDYIKAHYKLVKSNLNATFQDNGKEGGKVSVSGDINNNNDDGVSESKTSAVIDYTSNNTTLFWNPEVLFANLSEQLYVENNLVSNDYLNFFGERTIVSAIDTYLPVDVTTVNTNSPNQDTGDLFSGADKEETYLVTLHYLKTNIYVNFYRQQLVSTGQLNTSSTVTIYGGDSFIGEYSFITTASINGNLGNKEEDSGIVIYRNSLAESSYNVGLRHEGNGERAFAYYPVTDVEKLNADMSLLEPLNVIGYNRDYSSLNIFVSSDIFNPYEEYQNKFPYRIARSELQPNESTNLLWKTWKANNYFEADKEGGEIVNIASFANRLLIHHFYRLYATLEKTTLETTNAIIELGSGDLFRILPEKIVEENYAGTQQTHTPFIFKGGYVFVDSIQGKVFLLTQGMNIEEISNTGMKKFFEQYLPVTSSSFSAESRSFWVEPILTSGFIIISIPLNQDTFIPYIEEFIYSPTTDTTYEVLDLVKTYSGYTVTLNTGLIDKEFIEIVLEGVTVTNTKVIVDNKYQNTGYALGYDDLYNRLLLSKNVKNNNYLEKIYKTVTKTYQVTVPKTVITEVACNNSSIGANSNGGAGITDYLISSYNTDAPLVILFDAFAQLDKVEILVDTGEGFEVWATSSVFAEGNYGVTTTAVEKTATYPTTVTYTQTPVQGFDVNTGKGVDGGDIASLPFEPYTHVLFDGIRFLDEGAIDAPFESRPANSSDYTPPYNPFYIGSALSNIPSRYEECKADLASTGYDLDTSPSVAFIPHAQQLVHVKNIPIGASVIVRSSGFLGTGWKLLVLRISRNSICTETETTYETEEVEVQTEEVVYNTVPFCFSNMEYINGMLLKKDCGLLENYYNLGLVVDKNKQLKKLLLEGLLEEESLEIAYCCPIDAPDISAEWEKNPICITEGQGAIEIPVVPMQMFNVGYSVESSPTEPKGGVLTSSVNYFAGKINQGDSLRVTYTIGTQTTVHLCTARYSPDLSLPILFNIRLDVIPPYPIPDNIQYGSNAAPIKHLKVENLSNGEVILGGKEDVIVEAEETFTLTGFSYFETLVTSEGGEYDIPYPATAQEIADIAGIELSYAQELAEDRVNLDTKNCFPPVLKKSTMTVHARGEDTVKTILIEGQALHDLEIIPVHSSPVTSYKLDGVVMTLEEIQDTFDFNFAPDTNQSYEIEITTSNYNSPTEEAVYLVKYSEQGAASFPYTISLDFGYQLLSKDFILSFDGYVFVAQITGSDWYANVRIGNTDLVSFPIKNLSDLNEAISNVPVNTLYTIHFYLTEPIIVTINDKPTSLTKQYIAFSDKATDNKTALYLPEVAYNLEFVNPQNLSFKMTDGNVEKDDSIWNSLTFKTITEIRNEFGNGNKTILVQNNTANYERAYNAFLFNSELAYENVVLNFKHKEFYIHREISELIFDFSNCTVTIREDSVSAIKTTITSLLDVQNWFSTHFVHWAILEIDSSVLKTIKLR